MTCTPMKFNYISIDIETLGLDHELHDIIEFAAVLEDFETPIEDLPKFHTYIISNNDTYRGSPRAMVMHAEKLKILDQYKDLSELKFVDKNSLFYNFFCFINNYSFNHSKLNVIGKNFWKFNMRFLESQCNFSKDIFSHRSLDPGSLFFNKQNGIPSLEKCLQICGLEPTDKHTALGDAIDCIRAIRWHQNQQ